MNEYICILFICYEFIYYFLFSIIKLTSPLLAQKYDRIIETIQDAWEADMSARLSADMICERIRGFCVQEFGEKTTDSGVMSEVSVCACTYLLLYLDDIYPGLRN